MKFKRSWLPNLLTLGNLFCGFAAITFVVRGLDFYPTAVRILFLAGVLDIFDGVVAQVLNASSDFGRELDSLADVVSFGVAPALLVYEHSLHLAGWPGILVAGLFVCCSGSRLARYNVTTGPNGRYLTGMPTPPTALLVSATALRLGTINVGLSIILVVLTSLLMVSTLRFPRIPQIAFDAPLPIQLMFVGICVIGLSRPDNWILIPASYIAYGLLINLIEVLRSKNHS